MAKILQLKIELNEISPKIWRRFLVKDDMSFFDLHLIIQSVMGWEGYHLYEFKVGKELITCDEEGYNEAEASFRKLFKSPKFFEMVNKGAKEGKEELSLDIDKLNEILKKEREKEKPNKFDGDTPLNILIKSKKQKFSYVYDFGDSWKHIIIVEGIKDSGDSCVCLDGERACPPEDCGGAYGYCELLDIIKNKKHPLYEERIIDWLGEDHDFEHFDLKEVNYGLGMLEMQKEHKRTRRSGRISKSKIKCGGFT